MSHKYWKRTIKHPVDPSKDEVIYFATEGAEAHKKAEGDPNAVRITPEQYAENVPEAVHNGADRLAAPPAPDAHTLAANAAWVELQEWAAKHGGITPQEQIVMLELMSHRIKDYVWKTYGAKGEL